jgi:hypothetical protein
MKSKPFRFLDSAEFVSQLRSRLSHLGLESDGDRADDCELRFTCRWLPDVKIVLRWQYRWWPDDVNQEDAAVELIVDTEPVGSVDIDAILNRQLDRPLREEIVDQIVAVASSFTGKRA